MQHGTARVPKRWLWLAACALAGSASAQPDNCEALRTQIESKIAASGVTGFSVTVVDADAGASGQVVGSCALATRKIVYTRPGAPAAAQPPTGAAAASGTLRSTPLLTECKDGTSSVGGDCRK